MKQKLICLITLLTVILGTSALYAQNSAEDPAKTLFETKCSQCHALSRPLSKHKDITEWQDTTARMSRKSNSNISPEQAQEIAQYLSTVAGK